ncbi:MAG: T9SS type A sorting domain-containing protein [Ignavibacteria bacterium]|jgi:hypothetical protein|nr:T9SS type A sorting domain-containing protein [Ignavibacteria bacterium]
MKKIILLVAIIALSFNYLSNAEDLPKSASFEVVELTGFLHGDYKWFTMDNEGLEEVFIVKNISGADLGYTVTLDKVSMNDEHWVTFCIGLNCFSRRGAKQEDSWTSIEMSLAPDAMTEESTSYLQMFAGLDEDNAYEGMDTFKVTFTNASDASDFVSFYCYWNFHSASIETIKDISNQVSPNPVSEQLNIILDGSGFDAIDIYDMNGNRVISKDVTAIDNAVINVNSLSAGSYIGYNVKDGKHKEMFKFIKQ